MNTRKVGLLLSIIILFILILGIYIHHQNKEKRRSEIKQLVLEAERSLLQLN